MSTLAQKATTKKNRLIKRLQGRVKRYADNVDYFTKYPDSAALALNRKMLQTDLMELNALTYADD